MRTLRYMAILAIATLVLASANDSHADNPRITKGDVNAVFNAFGSAGRKIFNFEMPNNASVAAPADFFGSNGAIRPFEGSPWDGQVHCVDDWHVILIAVFDGPTYQDAVDSISPISSRFWLNGTMLGTKRSAIKRFLELPDPSWGYQEGAILSPKKLPVGNYELLWIASHPIFGVLIQQTIFFTVDPSESFACSD